MKRISISTIKKHFSRLRLLLLLVLVVFVQTGNSKGYSVVRKSALQVKTSFVFSGKVIDEAGKGIRGVVVNDGYNFILTDSIGAWKLTSDTTRSKFVSLTIPAAYKIHSTHGLADSFYVSVKSLVKSRNHDFKLEKRARHTDKFRYIAISDPQLANAHDLSRWNKETVPDIRRTVDAVSGYREVVGMTLGDLVFDNMPLFREYAESVRGMGLTLFNCIGNHDFDRRFKPLGKMPVGSANYAEMEYNRWFGPVEYSFNIGRVHVVTLCNIDYNGNGSYVERLTKHQLEWLKKDLSYVPKGSTVFLNLHAPGWNTVDTRANMRNAAVLENILRNYNTHVFCGHTHLYQNVQVSRKLYQHNIGAACGAWWTSNVNRCGAPNGYLVVDVDGRRVRWYYKATGRPADYQFRLYPLDVFPAQKSSVVANVWDWDDECSVIWYQDDRFMGSMERFTGTDETFFASQKNNNMLVSTSHLFKARPVPGTALVKVVFTNRFGHKFTQTIDLRRSKIVRLK